MPAEDEQVAAGSQLMNPDHGEGVPAPDGRKRLGRGWKIAIAILVVIAAAVLVAARWNVPYYAITPGSAFNVGTLISVPRSDAHQHKGAVFLVDVDLTQLSALGYLYYELHDSSAIVGTPALTGGQSNSAYDEEGVIDMANARQAATVVALHTLGYPTKAISGGSVVYALEPGTTAKQAPRVGSVVVAVDGESTLTTEQLVRAISARAPGSEVSLTFHAFGEAKVSTRTYQLGEFARSSKKTGSHLECNPADEHALRPVLVHGTTEACLPFGPEQIYRNVDLPFAVKLSAGGIVGPSAGLSFTLGLIERLDRADLTGGKRVAATGTMAINGSVGPVGGVAEKTRAVRSAGAQVFLVPPAELQAARANAGPHLKVIAVSSIGQAVSVLEGLGGRIESSVHRFES
jgi:Lon-like protease